MFTKESFVLHKNKSASNLLLLGASSRARGGTTPVINGGLS